MLETCSRLCLSKMGIPGLQTPSREKGHAGVWEQLDEGTCCPLLLFQTVQKASGSAGLSHLRSRAQKAGTQLVTE